jgi:hypothetical protein
LGVEFEVSGGANSLYVFGESFQNNAGFPAHRNDVGQAQSHCFIPQVTRVSASDTVDARIAARLPECVLQSGSPELLEE